MLDKVVKQGGPGALLLTFYLALSLVIWMPDFSTTEILLASSALSFLLAYLVAIFSDKIIGFLHWQTIVEVKAKIDEETDGEEFYFSHQENWEKLDDYDDKVYRNTVALISGSIITISLPI